MSNSSIKQVCMLILMEPSLEEAVTFYQQMGLQLIFHLKDKWAEFVIGNTRLGLCPTNNPPVEGRTGFVLEVDNLKEFHQRMNKHVQFLQEPIESAHGIMVSFRDPGGNIIDLYQPTPEKMAALVKEAAEKLNCSKEGCACENSCKTEA